MPYFDFYGKSIFYRETGSGQPLLLLNGIMMSTASWAPFEGAFSRGRRMLMLDLMDQGKSAKYDRPFSQELQAELVCAFLDELRIEKTDILGTSYGGEVALRFAVRYPHRLRRMVLANTVARTNAWLSEIGEAWNRAVGDPAAYYCTTIPVIYSPAFYDRKADWMAKRKEVLTHGAFADPAFLESMVRLTNSANDHDVMDSLPKIKTRTLIIGCERDHITPFEEQRKMMELMPNAELVMLPDTGHAAFYERPMLFASLVMGFLLNEEDEISI